MAGVWQAPLFVAPRQATYGTVDIQVRRDAQGVVFAVFPEEAVGGKPHLCYWYEEGGRTGATDRGWMTRTSTEAGPGEACRIVAELTALGYEPRVVRASRPGSLGRREARGKVPRITDWHGLPHEVLPQSVSPEKRRR